MIKTSLLSQCALASFVVCAGHALQSSALLYLGLLGVCVLFGRYSKSHCLQLLLFFLPFSNVLRPNDTVPSLYSLVILVLSLFACFLYGRYIPKVSLLGICTMLIAAACANIALTILPSLSYIQFFTATIGLIAYFHSPARKTSLEPVAVFMAVGTISAMSIAYCMFLNGYHTSFVRVSMNEMSGIARFTGFVMDPNFYSSQALASISCCLSCILAGYSKIKKWLWLLIGLNAWLGSLAISKSFIFILILILLVTAFLACRLKNFKMISVLSVVAGGLVIFSVTTSHLNEIISMYAYRLGEGRELNGLTTGRGDIYNDYYNYFADNVTMFLVGHGAASLHLRELNYAESHNLFIGAIYQLGLIGAIAFFFILFGLMIKTRKEAVVSSSRVSFGAQVLVYVGIVVPWFALDPTMMPDFFPFLCLLLTRYCNASNSLETV